MPRLELVTTINAPIHVCFDLARSIDFHKLSMADTSEEAIEGRITGLIELDDEVTWRARHIGVRQQLTSRITGYLYPNYFRDEMVKGIFKKMSHDHLFNEREGVTYMKDVFEFESPLGWVGNVANQLFLIDYLKNLLVIRNSKIKLMAENGQWKSILP